MKTKWYAVAILAVAGLTAGVTSWVMHTFERSFLPTPYPPRVVEIALTETDPAVWGRNFPREYDRWRKTRENYGRTRYGGSEPYSKLEANPRLKRLYAGHPFGADYNEERAEAALLDAIEAIKGATATGASGARLEQARALHRRAQMRWDFVYTENSTGFHSPQEAARILAEAIDLACQAQLWAQPPHGSSGGKSQDKIP